MAEGEQGRKDVEVEDLEVEEKDGEQVKGGLASAQPDSGQVTLGKKGGNHNETLVSF